MTRWVKLPKVKLVPKKNKKPKTTTRTRAKKQKNKKQNINKKPNQKKKKKKNPNEKPQTPKTPPIIKTNKQKTKIKPESKILTPQSKQKTCLQVSLKEEWLADSIWQTPSQKPEGNINKEEQSKKGGRLQKALGLWQSQKEMKIEM